MPWVLISRWCPPHPPQVPQSRGNISEIKTLALGSGKTRGVDADVSDAVSDENLDSAVAFVKDFAQRSHAIVAVTGAIDLVSDGHIIVITQPDIITRTTVT